VRRNDGRRYRTPARKNAPTAIAAPRTPARLLLELSMAELGIEVTVGEAEVMVAGMVVLAGAVPSGGEVVVGYGVVELQEVLL
jgi:hypothetical protein